MRVSLLGAVPVLAVITAVPAGAQISARVHVDIPIGRQSGVIYGAPRRQVIVRDYDEYRYGQWDSYYDYWEPVTLYYYDGYYYDYPIVAYAQPVIVFSYRNEYFLPPRVRAYDIWRRSYRPNGRIYGGGYGGAPAYGGGYRPYQPVPRGRDYGNDRNIPRYQPDPRGNGGRDYQPTPGGNGGRGYQPDPRGSGGRGYQPDPRGSGGGSAGQGRGNGGRQAQPAPRGGDNGQARGNGNGQGRGNGNVQGGRPGGNGNGRSRPRP